jgi:hypothetical protein
LSFLLSSTFLRLSISTEAAGCKNCIGDITRPYISHGGSISTLGTSSHCKSVLCLLFCRLFIKWQRKCFNADFKTCDVCSHYSVKSNNKIEIKFFLDSKTPVQFNKAVPANWRTSKILTNVFLVCFTSVFLVNVNESVNQHSCPNYAHRSVAVLGWLQIQEFSENQWKHSVTTDGLCRIVRKGTLFYYCS